jgi:gliding motility-associated-like protein
MEPLTCEVPNDTLVYTFVWTKHNPADNSWTQPVVGGGNVPTINIMEPGGYQVVRTGPDGTFVYRSWAFIPVLNEVEIKVDAETCTRLSLSAVSDSVPLIYYNPTSGAPIYANYNRTYEWTATPGTPFSGANPKIDAPVENTNYEVTVKSIKGGNESVSSLSYTALAVEADYDFEILKQVVDNEAHKLSDPDWSGPVEIKFTDKSKGNITQFEWRFGSVTNADLDPFHVFTTFGVDTISLTVVNSLSGCRSVNDTMSVRIKESRLLVPNVFTPNDNGQNDEFRVVYSSLKKYNIVVFNRWGRKVYESTNPAEGWDGTFAGGQAPPGVYFYYIEAEGINNNEKHKKSGPIHLLRGK